MLAQTISDEALNLIVGKIQTRIAKFLSLKEILYRLTLHSNTNIVTRAKTLSAVQEQLQTDLAKVLTDIEQMKTSGFSATGAGTLATFYYYMEKQIKDVSDLQDDAGYVPGAMAVIPSWFFPALLGIIGLLIFKRMR